MGRIDLHCHLLPAVDDGCKTVEESILCAKMLVKAGYSHCFCTPHIWPEKINQTRQAVATWTEQLQHAIAHAGVSLQLLPGGELNLHPNVMDTPHERIISMALDDRYILVDMWAERLPPWFEPAVRWLQGMNLTVILAHPERMRAVQQQPELADEFSRLGVLLQGNLQCLADREDSDTRRIAQQYLIEDRYFALGSDCHDAQGLCTRLLGLQNAVELIGQATVDQLTIHNPRKLLPAGFDTGS